MPELNYHIFFLSLIGLANCLVTLKNVDISFTNRGSQTDFVIQTNFGNQITLTNFWLGIGLGTSRNMPGANVAVCKILNGAPGVQHYYNQGYSPVFLNSANPTVGLSATSVTVSNGFVICKFTRDNTNADSRYFNLNAQSPYLLVAYGNSDIQYHGNNKATSTGVVSFPSVGVATTTSLAQAATSIPMAVSSTALSLSNTTITTTETILVSGKYSKDKVSLIWNDSTKSTYFEITGNENDDDSDEKDSSSNIYYAFALSKDKKMGDDDVAVCKIYNGVGSMDHYYNSGRSSALMDSTNPTVGFSNVKVTYINNVLKCSFSREKSMPNVKNYFDATSQKYYLLTANGKLETDGTILEHDSADSSSVQYVISQASQTVSSTTTITNPIAITSPIATFTTSATAGSGGYSAGPTSLKWIDSPKSTFFEVSGDGNAKRLIGRASTDNIYYAFAFSKDAQMGDDDVAVCKIYNGVGSVDHYYNNGKSPQLMDSTNPTVGFFNVKVNYVNNVLKCSFTREKAMPSLANYFDTTSQKYYLLTAHGNLDSSGMITRHIKAIPSSSQVDITSNRNLNGTATSKSKTKAHGCLMSFAWMFFASVGILLARYYKFLLPDKLYCGVKIWFVFHRSFMFNVPIISTVAFILILADSNWKWIESYEPVNFAHSITGIIAIALSFVQVFISFFRCDPASPNRFIFNYAHRTIGLTAFVLAIVTIYLGVLMDKMNLGNDGWGVMIGWTVWVVFLPLFFEVAEILFQKRSAEYAFVNSGELEPNDEPQEKQFEFMKTIFLFVHLIVSMAFTIALIVIIGGDSIS